MMALVHIYVKLRQFSPLQFFIDFNDLRGSLFTMYAKRILNFCTVELSMKFMDQFFDSLLQTTLSTCSIFE